MDPFHNNLHSKPTTSVTTTLCKIARLRQIDILIRQASILAALLHDLVSNKSATNQSSGVWA